MVAFVANNAVPRADLPALFEGLHSALKRLAEGGEVATAAIDPPAPAVSIRKSVTPDYLICLEDGKRFKSLRRHLAMLGMTPEQYRAKWNLPSDLSHGRAQFHGAAIGICEEQRVWAAREAHRRPAGGRSRDRGVVRADTIEVVTVEPTSGTKRKAKAKSKGVAAAPAAPVKRKPGRPRKATA